MHKNLVKRCPELEMRVAISRQLGELTDTFCRGDGTVSSFEGFMDDFIEANEFMEYIKAAWYPKLGQLFESISTSARTTFDILKYY